MENDLRWPPIKKLWAVLCFTLLIFLNLSAFQYCFSPVSCFVFFYWIFENNNCPGTGVLAWFLPQGSGFRTFFVPGNSPSQKHFPGDCVGGGQAWN